MTEGQEPAGTDPIDLQLPRGAAGKRKSTKVDDASDTFDRHEEFCCK